MRRGTAILLMSKKYSAVGTFTRLGRMPSATCSARAPHHIRMFICQFTISREMHILELTKERLFRWCMF